MVKTSDNGPCWKKYVTPFNSQQFRKNKFKIIIIITKVLLKPTANDISI